ncbi:cell envelope integrity protein CreD [Echinicola jeungdonensis]|uniref:Cell envelope integrity protein CreD n=1 Tax=Echinicola jeungdonensis TaxID=709343 RepID=A0ABV5J6J6_9BACT|nr:cell envelope integrity protein CreD [Echinicola jeungdonensis]MDN3669302.1 cell envelope integrity protein CreD [Echinicola jeungdonensis]
MKSENTLLEKIGGWISHSVTLKLIVITFLALLLLIPVSMIGEIIGEREALNQKVTTEVSSKWAGSQQINGPVLTIPLVYDYQEKENTVEITKYLYILPSSLKVNGEIKPEKLTRGIYEVVVYKSELMISGDFELNHPIDRNNLKSIRYDKAFLTMGISDLKGIKEQVGFKWHGETLEVQPGSRVKDILPSGITADLPDLEEKLDQMIPFELSLNLQGSQNMAFVPVGGITKVEITSSWNSPSFNGNFLPDSRNVSEDGFKASWRILQLNRNFPQSWIDNNQSSNLQASAFGIDLILPLDHYQKSMRSAKYAAMTIIITFLIFFLVEILNNRKIHPFQYALVGFALCLFFVLLVSLTEHIQFNLAYWISAFGIVCMISLYSLKVFKSSKLVVLLGVTLVGAFGFLFVTLQLTEYALLMGSIGLTIILALTMYFTRNVDWYRIGVGKD